METIWLTDWMRGKILTELYFLRSNRRTSQFVSFLASLFCSNSSLDSHQWPWRNQLGNLHLIPAQTLSTPEWSWERWQMLVAAVLELSPTLILSVLKFSIPSLGCSDNIHPQRLMMKLSPLFPPVFSQGICLLQEWLHSKSKSKLCHFFYNFCQTKSANEC